MKSGSRWILHRFGFRRSLIVIGLMATPGYASCALFRPGWADDGDLRRAVSVGLSEMSFQFTATTRSPMTRSIPRT